MLNLNINSTKDLSPKAMNTIFSGKHWSIQRFISGFANNAYLITCRQTNKSVIIDTPAKPTALISAAKNTEVTAVLITHGHRDHVEGLMNVTTHFEVPIGIGIADRESLPESAQTSINFTKDHRIEIGNIGIQTVATPGHTQGSTCFIVQPIKNNKEHAHIFSGDTLFPGGPGKSASHARLIQMIDSIKTHIFTLEQSTVVLPGHGEFITVGNSKKEYDLFSARPLDPTLYGNVTWLK